ncbi:MAG: ATP synthase subunit I [Lachnospiraceae bacterium]|nr:ATP synthase subunit I [Lachnospiraceae bacterium]MBO7340373.1 ATP synthase subunit I [Lachnospiraceae bacterium]MBP5732885.1 ATP synthase subunit I [Lachnospiraceae bacterium]MCR5501017.1 ATP synthase subunit I [Acetatifactor sp.]
MNDQNTLLEKLRKKNRTVLEMELGIIALGILFQLGSVFFPGSRLERAVSLLLGSVLAGVAVLHMYRTLDRALDLDAGDAQKAIYKGYVLRYVFFALVLVLSALTGWLNPLLIFLGYMTLKFTAYLQPLTHKLCNRIFHETDPDPLPEEEVTE